LWHGRFSATTTLARDAKERRSQARGPAAASRPGRSRYRRYAEHVELRPAIRSAAPEARSKPMTTAADLDLRTGARPAALAGARPQLIAATLLLLLANAAAAKAIEAVTAQGALAALAGGLGHSWAFWLACIAAVRLALRESAAPVRPRDLMVCAACALVALLPASPLAGLACTFLAAMILLDRAHGPYMRAAGWVLGAISVQLVWSRILMLFFGRPITAADAHLVSWIIHRPVTGNTVWFVEGQHTLSIADACTSVQNASTALMLFVAVTRSFRPVPRPGEAYALAGVFLSVVAINLVRLSLMAQTIPMFHLVHGPVGAGVVNAVITLTGLAWAVATVRHEILD
jgi:hypothetical protein